MEKKIPKKMQENLAQMTSCLDRHGLSWARPEGKPFLILNMPTEHPMLREIRLRITAYECAFCFHTQAPLASSDKMEMMRLINALNLEQEKGLYQYDVRDGELCYSRFAPSDEAWPGDCVVMDIIEDCRENVLKISDKVIDSMLKISA